MASDKYKAIASNYLNAQVDRLADWLEVRSKAIRGEQGEDTLILIERTEGFDPEWDYASLGFDLKWGTEIL